MSLQTPYMYANYDIEKCSKWIQAHSYKKICLQFPENLLKDGPEIAASIEENCVDTEIKLFLIGDTSHRSCCVDFYAAKHINADAIIHFGRACLSPFGVLPTLFVFPKENLDVNLLLERINDFIVNCDPNKFVVLLYDVVFAHYIDEIRLKLTSLREKIFVSHLMIGNEGIGKVDESVNCIVKKLGRWYCVPRISDQNIFVYIASSNDRKNLENFVISSPENDFYVYNPISNSLQLESVPKTIKRRLFDIEKTKQARRIGILVATLEVDSFLDVLNRIKKLCKLKGKKSYIISVGKPNVAKLANFPEIDLFVMISCPEAEISDKKEYFQPIVTVMEIELALNDNQSWSGKVVNDFREFLSEGSEYKPIDEQNIANLQPDISLIDNKVSILNVDVDKKQNGERDLAIRNDVSTMAVHNVREGLVCRSWKGLQMDTGSTEIQKVTIGRKGTPSSGYTYQQSENIT